MVDGTCKGARQSSWYQAGCVSHLSLLSLPERGLLLSVLERRGSAVVSTSACHAGGPGSRPGPGTLLGVKTWLSTLEIVYLCVFRMRH